MTDIDDLTPHEAYMRGYRVATARAESRRRLGLPIDRQDREYTYADRVEPTEPRER